PRPTSAAPSGSAGARSAAPGERAYRSPRGAGPAGVAARPWAVRVVGATSGPTWSTGRASPGGPRRRPAAAPGRRSRPGSAWRRAGRGGWPAPARPDAGRRHVDRPRLAGVEQLGRPLRVVAVVLALRPE